MHFNQFRNTGCNVLRIQQQATDVNSLRNKFEAVEELVQNKIDICFLSEIKIDETFPTQQLMINGYKLFRRELSWQKLSWWRHFMLY